MPIVCVAVHFGLRMLSPAFAILMMITCSFEVRPTEVWEELPVALNA